LQNFHATSLANNPAAVAMNAANAAAAIAAAEVAHKRPRLDLSHPPGPVAGSSTAGPASNSISQPLRIDTRETVKESCYQPPLEAISPTGPEAPGDQMDDLKAVKDELLTKITKVDREIAKTESQIAKLKKKYQEQEEHANKPLSDSNEDTVEEKPKNQSIAQVIYAENRDQQINHDDLMNNLVQIVVQAIEPLTATAAHGLAQENLSPTPKPVQISPSMDLWDISATSDQIGSPVEFAGDKQSIKEKSAEAKAQSMDQVKTTLVQTPKLTKVENMNGEQVSYKVTLLANQDDKSGETKSEVRRFVVPQDCSTSMVYLKEKLR